MEKTSNINIRIDDKLKKEAEKLFNDLGINMSSAINVFLKQSVREQKIPFEIRKNIQIMILIWLSLRLIVQIIMILKHMIL